MEEIATTAHRTIFSVGVVAALIHFHLFVEAVEHSRPPYYALIVRLLDKKWKGVGVSGSPEYTRGVR